MTFKPHDPNEPKDNGRMMVAIVISLLILFGFHFFYEKPRMETLKAQQAQEQEQQRNSEQVSVPAGTKAEVAQRAVATVDPKNAPKIKIEGDKVRGSISLAGLRLDDLYLKDYYETVDQKKNVRLLSPASENLSYYIESGWIADNKALSLPGPQTVWSFAPNSARTLESGGSVTVQWNNGQGLLFERTISLDENYLFSITQRVTNRSANAVTLYPFHLASRHNLPSDYVGMFILHEGPVGYFEQDLQELSYNDLLKGERVDVSATGGWAGYTDKYWFVGMIPDQSQKLKARFTGREKGSKDIYQVDLVGAPSTLAPGQSIEDSMNVFAGAKVLSLLNSYEDKLGVKHLDLALDFGIWYFITKPLFLALTWLGHYFGHIGAGILLLTVLVRLAIFPLANKSFRSMAGMKKIAPQLKELQEKYKDDRARLQQEIMSLYQREQVNPFSGCWPILVQIPIFFALYKVILISIEMRHAPFWGWIDDLSAADPTSILNGFGLLPWAAPDFLSIGLWPTLFCITMVIQKRLNPPMPDPLQEKIQTFFPYIITIILSPFAAGLVIYWTWSNTLGIIQQYYILRSAGNDVSLVRGHAERRRRKNKSGSKEKGKDADKKETDKEDKA